ncbi:hypothetical protein [Roseovarius nitratireducens]|uniref:hypothetical protein n=1 Tax=Roseovarius nitratireducens TaxID=2044597 RepID=UPI0013EC78D2|nr:hypothetical protein [Roseovarius nitratireducens]
MTDQTRHLSDASEAFDAAFGPGFARDNAALVTTREISAEVGETSLRLKPRLFG